MTPATFFRSSAQTNSTRPWTNGLVNSQMVGISGPNQTKKGLMPVDPHGTSISRTIIEERVSDQGQCDVSQHSRRAIRPPVLPRQAHALDQGAHGREVQVLHHR